MTIVQNACKNHTHTRRSAWLVSPSSCTEGIAWTILGVVFKLNGVVHTIAWLRRGNEWTQPTEPPVLSHHFHDVAAQVLAVLVASAAIIVVRLAVPDLHQLQTQKGGGTQENHEGHGGEERGDERNLKVTDHPRHHGEQQGRDEAEGQPANRGGHDPRAGHRRVHCCDDHVDEKADEVAMVVVPDAPPREVAVVVPAQYAGLAQRAVPRAGWRVVVAHLAEHPAADMSHGKGVAAT